SVGRRSCRGLAPPVSRRRPWCVCGRRCEPALGGPRSMGPRSVPMTRTTRKPARAKPAGRRQAATRPNTSKPIALYYWPTPNGWKISIMLEECRLPYSIVPVDISKGEQFAPEFLAISPNNRMPAIVDPAGPGGRPISIFESGAILQYLGRKTGKFYPGDERGRVEVDQWLFWQMANLGPKARRVSPLPPLRSRPIAVCGRTLHQRDQSPLRGDEPAARGPRLPRRPLFDRRHGMRRLGTRLEAAGAGHRGVPAPQALARPG